MSLKLGFVGVGGIATRHLDGAKARDDVTIVGHCDVNEARVKEVAEKYGGNAYSSCVDLYDTEKPDAIVIATPPFAHGEIEEEACKRGIHFFVEKPVAVSMDLAMRVHRAVEASNVFTQVGYMYRMSKPLQQVKQLLTGRNIAMVQAHFYMPGLPPPDWYPILARSGGQLVEQATHILDLGRFLAGDVISVTSRTARVRDWTPPAGWEKPDGMYDASPDFDIPDTVGMVMQYESGAMGTLSCSIVPQGSWDVGFKVVADGLLVTIDQASASWTGDETGEAVAADTWALNVLYDFVDSVIAGERPSIPYIEGVKSLAVSLAGYASVEAGGPVAMSAILPAELS